MALRRLVFENQNGQRVRTFDANSDSMYAVHCADSGRLEFLNNLDELETLKVEHKVLEKFSPRSLSNGGLNIRGYGHIRYLEDNEEAQKKSPVFELKEDQDERVLPFYLKQTTIAHLVLLAAFIGMSFLFNTKKEEPQLVTIVIPKKEEIRQDIQKHIKVAEKKITPKVLPPKVKIAEKTVIKPQPIQKPVAKAKVKPVIKHEIRRVVRSEQPKNVNNVGALAALGGLKNGTKGYQGLDNNSLKNIRSAGVGAGGGGVGNMGGSGGMKGVLPGTGMIAGSAGFGGRAESAGGYGTKGVGGGRAGYGKINLVGGTGGISLPLDDEATVEGGLDRDQIAAVINRHKGEIIYCYEQGLQGKPELAGRVSVDFVIGANGRITRAKVAQSSLSSNPVESCMIARMKGWQFPKPVGKVNVDVLYPFELRRVSGRS